MATARRTGTSENVSTYGTSAAGRDYTLLGTWEFDTTYNLVSGTTSEVLECYDDLASFDDSMTMSGATTSTSYMRIVRPASGQGHDGTSNNGFFISTTGNVDCIRIDENNVKIQDLILKTVQNSTSNRHGVYASSGTGIEIVGCIAFECSNAGSGSNRGLYTNGTSIFVDCLSEANEQAGFLNVTGTTHWYNCTGHGNSVYQFWALTGTTHAINCLAGTATGYSGTFATGTNCASSDASSPDATRRNKTFTFVSTAGNDFHLDSADAGAKDDGTDLSADATFAFDDDIDGDLFDTWDIGFDENSPPSGGGAVPHNPLGHPLVGSLGGPVG